MEDVNSQPAKASELLVALHDHGHAPGSLHTLLLELDSVLQHDNYRLLEGEPKLAGFYGLDVEKVLKGPYPRREAELRY